MPIVRPRSSSSGSAGPPATLVSALCALVLLVAACASGAAPASRDDATVRVAAFDFPESQVLAALYARGLRDHGVRAVVIGDAGTREVVQPALEQGQVDLVPEYQASALEFLRQPSPSPSATAARGADAVHRELTTVLGSRGVVVLAAAEARDQNGFVMTRARARALGLGRLSQLRAVAMSLVLGGPPECPDRPYCLQGLQRVYGVSFRSFVPMPSRAVTAQALLSGEIDVGMLETTDPSLVDPRLMSLGDDRHLQPSDNVVPVVRAEVLRRRQGPAIAAALNAVTARLTTAGVIGMNRRVAVDGLTPAAAAAEWWAKASKSAVTPSGRPT
jgi:osmoprotectant transport system substrate-binding protein